MQAQENFSVLASQRNKQRTEKNIAYNNFTQEQNTIALSKVQLEENEQALIQAKNDYQSQLIQAKEALKKIEGELSKQQVIATSAGIINYVFNTKQSSNLIAKSELLVSLAPTSLSYYARVAIPEKDMPYMKAGLSAKLKLDAYQQYRQGLINGTVSYIAERKENEKFYALVQLADVEKFGLKSGYSIYGEIIIQRLPLYKFFMKKLFRQFS